MSPLLPVADDNFDTIADELYALRPEEFAAARNARVKEARAGGDAALARELAKLRRPTLSAWLLNLLWRDQREVMEQLFQLSQELGRAQAEASGPALRELTAQRRQLESALLQRATVLARQAGANVTDSVVREAQETLSAALAEPDVADDVRSGRLVKPTAYSGFGALPGTRPVVSTPAREPIDITTVQRAREREQAQRRVEQARELLDAATREVSNTTRAAETARQRRADLIPRLEQLREQLRKAEFEVQEAEREATTSEHARERAEKARDAAQDALERAQQALEKT